MPELLGSLPCQAPCEYIFLTWTVLSGSDLHLSAHWQLCSSAQVSRSSPVMRTFDFLLCATFETGPMDISGFKGQWDWRIYPQVNTALCVTAKYLTSTKDNVFENLEEETRHRTLKMKKECGKNTKMNNFKIGWEKIIFQTNIWLNILLRLLSYCACFGSKLKIYQLSTTLEVLPCVF